LVFPELKRVDFNDEYEVQRTISFKTSALDKILRKHVAPAADIEGKLTMHIARHTSGGLAVDAIAIQILQKLSCHSNATPTIGYQANFIHQQTDDALDAVINKTKIDAPQASIRDNFGSNIGRTNRLFVWFYLNLPESNMIDFQSCKPTGDHVNPFRHGLKIHVSPVRSRSTPRSKSSDYEIKLLIAFFFTTTMLQHFRIKHKRGSS